LAALGAIGSNYTSSTIIELPVHLLDAPPISYQLIDCALNLFGCHLQFAGHFWMDSVRPRLSWQQSVYLIDELGRKSRLPSWPPVSLAVSLIPTVLVASHTFKPGK
jgi:hypothetical protein